MNGKLWVVFAWHCVWGCPTEATFLGDLKRPEGFPCPTEQPFPGRRWDLGDALGPVASVLVVPGTVHSSVSVPR